ncbi:unnamed protein product [Arabidopsis halleri]
MMRFLGNNVAKVISKNIVCVFFFQKSCRRCWSLKLKEPICRFVGCRIVIFHLPL